MSQYPGAQIAAMVRDVVARAIDQERFVSPATETKLRTALDMLRASGGAPAQIAKLEQLSCAFERMYHLRRQGRVNAYASALLRTKRAIQAL